MYDTEDDATNAEALRSGLGHRLIGAQHNAGSSKLDESEEVGGVLLIKGRDGSVRASAAEEAFDEVVVTIQEDALRRLLDPMDDVLDVGLSTSALGLTQRFAVVCAVCEQVPCT